MVLAAPAPRRRRLAAARRRPPAALEAMHGASAALDAADLPPPPPPRARRRPRSAGPLAAVAARRARAAPLRPRARRLTPRHEPRSRPLPHLRPRRGLPRRGSATPCRHRRADGLRRRPRSRRRTGLGATRRSPPSRRSAPRRALRRPGHRQPRPGRARPGGAASRLQRLPARIARYRQATAGQRRRAMVRVLHLLGRSRGRRADRRLGQGYGLVDDVWAWGQRAGKAITAGSAPPAPAT